MPIAVNCSTVPNSATALVGVIAIDVKVAEETVKVAVLLVTPLKVAVILVVPAATGVAKPLLPDALLIVAIDVCDDIHVTSFVISLVLASEYVPIAVYCSVVPNSAFAVIGVIAIDVNVIEFTVKTDTELVTPFKDAVILVVPAAIGVTKPLVSLALLIEAIVGFDDVHSTCVVISWLPPSEYMPTALICIGVLIDVDGFIGDTSIDCNVAEDTVKTDVELVTPLKVAVILVVPTAIGVARPSIPVKLLIVATLDWLEAHVAWLVISSVLPSE